MRFLKRLFSASAKPKTQQVGLGDRGLEIEYCSPIESGCECCTSITTTLNRLVTRGGQPYAMCRITFSDSHLDSPAKGIFGIGLFGEGTFPEQRVAFAALLRPDGVMIVDATELEWPECGLLGPKLSREAAMKHERKEELFRLTDELYLNDVALVSHFAKVVRAN